MEDKNYEILIPFDKTSVKNSSVVMIAVRPETNKIDYESIIIKSASNLSKPVYMANLNGKLLEKNNVITEHYFCQYQFASKGKSYLSQYPEMVKSFEDKFSIDFDKANIIGSFEAIRNYKDEIGLNEHELFHLLVKRKDFLEFYGQTIKHYKDFYIVNYDIPAILKNYSTDSNILVLALKMDNPNTSFSKLNYQIFNNFETPDSINIIDFSVRNKMEWYNQVRRTYHISRNHIDSMLDMKDYIYTEKGYQINFEDTPLGQKLLERNIYTKQNIESILSKYKLNPLQYIKNGNSSKLCYLPKEGYYINKNDLVELSLDNCADIFKNITT